MSTVLARLDELAQRHAAGDDVLAELRALEAELRVAGASPEGEPARAPASAGAGRSPASNASCSPARERPTDSPGTSVEPASRSAPEHGNGAAPDAGDPARAALLRARFRAGPLPLPGDAPTQLHALSERLCALPIGPAAAAEVRTALDALAALARERDDAAARQNAEARRGELHVQVLELLGELLDTLDGRRR